MALAPVSERSRRRLQTEMDRWGNMLAAGTATVEEMEHFIDLYPRLVRDLRVAAGVTPVPIKGSRGKGIRSGFFQARMLDGAVGYFQRRHDDCLTAGLASLAQMQPHLVPDLQLNKLAAEGLEPEQIEDHANAQLERWQAKYGLEARVHLYPPTTGRWVAVIGTPMDGNDHCVVMKDRTPIFDPSLALPRGKDEPPTDWDLNDMLYSITVERQ
jgi:hypothetical protein